MYIYIHIYVYGKGEKGKDEKGDTAKDDSRALSLMVRLEVEGVGFPFSERQTLPGQSLTREGLLVWRDPTDYTPNPTPWTLHTSPSALNAARGIAWSHGKHGRSAQQDPVSAYGGSFKNLQDLEWGGGSGGGVSKAGRLVGLQPANTLVI